MCGALVDALTTGTWEQGQTRLYTAVPPEPGANWIFVSADLLPRQRFRVTVTPEVAGQ